MSIVFFLGSVILLMLGHCVKLMRWSRFIKLYELPRQGTLMRAMSLGYALNFVLPFKLGEVFRALYAGRRMKNGVGLALATIILDRFLDILAASVIFALLWCLGIKRALVLDSAGFYFLATALMLVGFVFINVFSFCNCFRRGNFYCKKSFKPTKF